MKLLALISLFLLAGTALAQEVPYTGRPRYPDGRLTVTVGGGISKYNGEFLDQSVGEMYWAQASFALANYLRIGLQGEKGKLYYNRRWRRNTRTSYEIQFGNDPALNGVDRGTDFTAFTALVFLDLLPGEFINPYLYGGAGKLWYTPEDYSARVTRYYPASPEQETWVFPGGLGIDILMGRTMAFNLEIRANLTSTGGLDAFASDYVRDTWAVESGVGRNPNAAETANDLYFSLTAGVKFFLFPDNDIDGDGLSNDEEEELGTNPYDVDTDGDLLTDWHEVTNLHSDPRKMDSDDDGLTDYEEAVKYHTRPDTLDTDGDGIRDAEEIQRFNTDPHKVDSDGDQLPDGRELQLGTNPNRVDTDGDGLSDGDEYLKYGTDPLLPDSDGDGIGDYDEVFVGKTEAASADSDKDGLTDFEERSIEGTDPFNPDTDGDGLTDYEELRIVGTDPKKADTDGDGFNDKEDRCPRLPENRNGYQDNDGCPDVKER
ncbi:MAG: hypothetical protein IH600_04740 [Bacteroidetes bacterium]|nr:hypothetical protein [Bacteroidota bacterium]